VPVYEYSCSVCGHTVEVRHGVHGHGPAACPVCGGPMRKLLSPPTIVFKGTGWATKEGRSRGGRTSGGSSASRSGGEGASSGSRGDEAPAPPSKGAASGPSSGSGSGD
jgi:putative FmdB family regulatory protein